MLTPGEIDADVMMFTAIIGLIFNLIQMGILHDDEDHGGHDHGNMNVNQAFLHALSDMLNSIGVCIASVIIWAWPDAKVADPICAFLFAVLVVVQCKESIGGWVWILMEGAPSSVDQDKLAEGLKACGEDVEIKHFRLWQVSAGKNAFSCHLYCNGEPMETLDKAEAVCKGHPFALDIVTIQVKDIAQGAQVPEDVDFYGYKETVKGGHSHGHSHGEEETAKGEDDGHGHHH